MEEHEIENEAESELDYTQLDDKLVNELYSDAIEASSAVLVAKGSGYYDETPGVDSGYAPCAGGYCGTSTLPEGYPW